LEGGNYRSRTTKTLLSTRRRAGGRGKRLGAWTGGPVINPPRSSDYLKGRQGQKTDQVWDVSGLTWTDRDQDACITDYALDA